MTRPVVTLTTDFGTVDGYVGAMKGVLAARAPGTTVLDVTHEIPRGDVAAAAFAVAQAAPCFPRGSVHVVVVDPEVGGARRGVVVVARGRRFVGPDNGVFDLVVAGAGPGAGAVKAWEITARRWRRAEVAPTFHGRDVFAPAAALLAKGARPASAGPAVELVGRGGGEGGGDRVLHVDRFGNLITTLAPGPKAVSVAGRTLPLRRTYSDVAVGELVAYVGSAGTIEIGVRDGSAAQVLGLARGAPVEAASP